MAKYRCLDCDEVFEPAPSMLGPACPKCGSTRLRLAAAMAWEADDDGPEEECVI